MAYRSRACTFLAAVVLTGAMGMGVPLAQAQTTEDDISVLREEARELYRKAMKRYVAGRFAQARASFLAAWSLEKHWSIALGLGDCEVQMGKYRDAAEHLAFAMREMPADHPSREKATEAMGKARLHVAELRVTVDVDGTELFVDGKLVGKSPLTIPVFVEPGERTVEGRVPNREASRTIIEARAGGAYPVRFVMTPGSEPTHEPVVPPAAVNEPKPNPNPEQGAETAESDSNARAIVTWTGAGLTLAAAGVGLVYTLKASSASSDVDMLQDRIDGELGPNGCGQTQAPICDDLRQRFDDRDSATTTATAAWIVSGVLLGTTVGAYLLWPDEKSASKATDKSARGPQWTWTPVVLPEGAAISFQGSLP